jgi:hypothetical protein
MRPTSRRRARRATTIEALAARFGGSCPRWVVHEAFATPGRIRVQVARLPDGATFLTVARSVQGRAAHWGEPPRTHVVAMGCDIARAPDLVHADGIEPETAAVGIGLSCRLCDRAECRSRAFPPLEHRLVLDPAVEGAAPYRFEAPARVPVSPAANPASPGRDRAPAARRRPR